MSTRQLLCKAKALRNISKSTKPFLHLPRHGLHTCRPLAAVKPFLLSDPGEGIKEVQIIQWFVQPGARVAEFDKVCEIASDKAVTEITSRYEGVIKTIHFEADDFVQVGQALLDIDVQNGDIEVAEDLPKGTPGQSVAEGIVEQLVERAPSERTATGLQPKIEDAPRSVLATPAVRGLLKQHDVDIAQVEGSGTDGRILKEDVQQHIETRDSATTNSKVSSTAHPGASITAPDQVETAKALTPVQAKMLKTMTRSLNIPHFLYTEELDLSSLSTVREKLNSKHSPDSSKLTTLSFIIKALAITIAKYPLLNARLDAGSPTSKSQIYMRSQLNIGIAIDTPSGLLVPNIKDVANLSINNIALELSRLQILGQEGKLTPTDLKGGTITVSNIGSIGGMYVSPLIVEGEVTILGVGREKVVPGFDEKGNVVRKKVCAFSWSADHRVLDGAYVARAAERVRRLLEEPAEMIRCLS